MLTQTKKRHNQPKVKPGAAFRSLLNPIPTMTTAEAISFAAKRNAEVAALTDNQLYLSCAGRELRAAATAALEAPIIATAPQIRECYGVSLEKSVSGINLDAVADHNPEDVFIWAFMADKGASRKRNISIAAIAKIEEQ